jgi:uncharacterized protein
VLKRIAYSLVLFVLPVTHAASQDPQQFNRQEYERQRQLQMPQVPVPALSPNAVGIPSQTITSSKPTFDCAKATRPIALIICSGEDGAKADWALSAAAWAYAFTLDEQTRLAFSKAEDEWIQSLNQICDLTSGRSSVDRACVIGNFNARAKALQSRLTGDALAEARLTPEQRASIQGKLVELGYMTDAADGEFGPSTRSAIQLFHQARGGAASNFLSVDERAVLMSGAQSTVSQDVNSALPSFDCSKARQPDEQVICSSNELSHLDALIASGYAFVRARYGDQKAREVGVPLLSARNACGSDAACVRSQQLTAIQAYKSLGAPIAIPQLGESANFPSETASVDDEKRRADLEKSQAEAKRARAEADKAEAEAVATHESLRRQALEVRDQENWARIKSCSPSGLGAPASEPQLKSDAFRNASFVEALSIIDSGHLRFFQQLLDQTPSPEFLENYWAKSDNALLQKWLRGKIDDWASRARKSDFSWTYELSDLLTTLERNCIFIPYVFVIMNVEPLYTNQVIAFVMGRSKEEPHFADDRLQSLILKINSNSLDGAIQNILEYRAKRESAKNRFYDVLFPFVTSFRSF